MTKPNAVSTWPNILIEPSTPNVWASHLTKQNADVTSPEYLRWSGTTNALASLIITHNAVETLPSKVTQEPSPYICTHHSLITKAR